MTSLVPENGASSGRIPSFDELYRTYFPQVERWSRRLAGPGESVEDFVHDVFLVVHRRLPEWRGEAKLTSWLFAICDRIGRKRRRRRRLAQLMTPFDPGWTQHAADQPSPHELAERGQRHGHLYQALDQLSDKYRTPLILFELEGMTGEQLAELLAIPLATVWVRLHRGRARLFELVRKRLGDRQTGWRTGREPGESPASKVSP